MSRIAVSIGGAPVPQGSMRAFAHPSTGRIVMTSQQGSRLTDWRQTIAWHVRQQYGGSPWVGPIEVDMYFRLKAPKKRAHSHPTFRPDIDKLSRAVLDALTGVLWEDDGQVVSLTALKIYGEPGLELFAKQL